MKRLCLMICVLWLILSGVGTVVSAQVPTYKVETILPAPYCTSVDLSADGTKLSARIVYGDWDLGFRIFNALTHELIRDCHVDDTPWTGLFSSNSRYIWSTFYYEGSLAKIDVEACEVVQRLGLGSWTWGLAFDSKMRYLYVGENCPGTNDTGSLVVVDTVTASVVARIPLNGEPGTGTQSIVLDPYDQFVYVLTNNLGTETLYKIRTSDYAVEATLALPGVGNPGISLSPDGRIAYVPHTGANLVYKVDTSTMRVVGHWPIDSPHSFLVSPDGTHALVMGHATPRIQVFDLSLGEMIQTIELGDLGYYYPHATSYYWDLRNGRVYIPIHAARGGAAVLVAYQPTELPVADAGDDIIADANEEVTLDGSGSSDPDGQIIRYTWKRLPDGVVIYSGPEPTCQTRALGRVEEVIELTVTDDSLATATDTLKIISRTTQQLKDQLAALQSQIDQVQRQNRELQALVDKISSFPPIAQWLRRAAKFGDLNGDGQINMADFALLTKHWLH